MGSKITVLSLMLASALPLTAQGGLNGSRLGIVYDGAARSLRPVVGYPGAAYIAEALLPEVDAASISPDGRFAVLRQGEKTQLQAIAKPGEALLALPAFRQVLWSDDNRYFALVAEEGGAFFVYENDAVRAWVPVQLSDGLQERHRDEKKLLALDSLRRQLWLGQRGSDPALYVISFDSGESERLALPGGAEALALPWTKPQSSQSAPSIWRAAAQDRLYRLERPEGSWRIEALPSLQDAAERQTRWLGLRQTGDASWLGVRAATDTAPAQILRHDATGRLMDFLDVDSASEGLYPISGSSFYLLRQSLGKTAPLEVYDTSEQRLYFVPVDRSPALNSTGGAL